MSFLDFAKKQRIKTIDTGESIRLGSFKEVNSGELFYIRALVYIHNVSSLSGSEQLNLKIYGEETNTSLLYTSAWSNISAISNIGTTNWLGFVRFLFNRENINKNNTYYLGIGTKNYTRNGDTFYIGAAFDFPVPVYDNSDTLFTGHPLAFQIFTYKE